MDERFAQLGNGVTLCYETFGSESDPTLLLVMGLGMQMLAWDERLCGELADRGLFVVRFDNRDAGRSTILDDVPTPTVAQIVRRRAPRGSYRLADMAQDVVGLLDALGRDSAHVVGASMGGMIAQTLAARHPERVRSLTSIMSSTGARWSGQPKLRTYPVFLAPAARDREEYVRRTLKLFRLIGSPGYELDELELRALAGVGFDRAYHPRAAGRQLAAIFASGDRRRELATVRTPTLVIHGDADRLVAPSGGRATAKAIPGARLMTIRGMGHDLPRGVWPQVLGAIEDHVRAAEARRASAPAAAGEAAA